MEKAFDHVSWDFHFYRLGRCGFGRRWCKWSTHRVSTARLSVLVHNSPVIFFNSSRGLRQGDLLSPFLFVIAMDALGQMLRATINGGFLAGFLVGGSYNGLINISHLLFAYDMLLFCDVNPGQVQTLRAHLLCFGAVLPKGISWKIQEILALGKHSRLPGFFIATKRSWSPFGGCF